MRRGTQVETGENHRSFHRKRRLRWLILLYLTSTLNGLWQSLRLTAAHVIRILPQCRKGGTKQGTLSSARKRTCKQSKKKLIITHTILFNVVPKLDNTLKKWMKSYWSRWNGNIKELNRSSREGWNRKEEEIGERRRKF